MQKLFAQAVLVTLTSPLWAVYKTIFFGQLIRKFGIVNS